MTSSTLPEKDDAPIVLPAPANDAATKKEEAKTPSSQL